MLRGILARIRLHGSRQCYADNQFRLFADVSHLFEGCIRLLTHRILVVGNDSPY